VPSGSVFEKISGDVGRSEHPFLLGPTHHTYGDLLRAAERIAHRLKERGAKPGSRVAVCLDQGLAYVASLIGI
jgi:acyl-CoA synthetase (AMP-forming)/AMP-acid ligase II